MIYTYMYIFEAIFGVVLIAWVLGRIDGDIVGIGEAFEYLPSSSGLSGTPVGAPQIVHVDNGYCFSAVDHSGV